MIKAYENVPDDIVINLLYSKPVTLVQEMHIVNIFNKIEDRALIKNPEQLQRFKQYINFVHQISIQAPELMKFCPAIPFYNLDNVIQHLKIYFEITELTHNGEIIEIKINKKR